MTPTDYIKDRLDDQLEWHDRKSIAAQNIFKHARTVEFVCAAAIPFLAGLVMVKHLLIIQLAIGLAGLTVAVIVGLQGLYQWQEHWIQYRSIAEALKREKMHYLTNTGAYTEDEASNFKSLVNRVEALLADENQSWAKNMLAAGEKKATDASSEKDKAASKPKP